MGGLPSRLGDKIDRHRNLVLVVWAVIFLAAVPFAARQQEHLTSGGGVAPDSGSGIVDSARDKFPGSDTYQHGILLEADESVSPAELRARERRVREVIDDADRIATLRPRTKAEARRFDQPRAKFIPITLSGNQDQRWDAVHDVRDELGVGKGADAGITTYIVGQDGLWAALHDLQVEDLTDAETIGIPITLAILLLTFGAWAAAGLPLLQAAVAVTLTGAVVFFVSLATSMSAFVTNAASMIGIGVAVDYSLFVVARYREELAGGAGEDDARRRAMATSGVAVIFSAVTVIVALLGIFLVDSKLLRSMALGMIVIVAISLVSAVTLLPALIDVFGKRVNRPAAVFVRVQRMARGAGRLLRRRERDESESFWFRWTRAVMRRPILSVAAASAVMILLAVPALSMDLDERAVAQFPKDHEARVGLQKGAQIVGPGQLGPVEVLADFDRGTVRSPENRRALERYVTSLRRRPDVARVDEPHLAPSDPTQAFITVVQKAPPETPAARRLTDDLRVQAAAGGGLAAVADVHVGGNTALPADLADLITDSMVKITLFVLIVSYFALLIMLRSVLLPLKAVLMTVLSVISAYGVLVVIFQWGWFDSLFNYDSPGYVEAPAPPLMLAMVFGLSMDYEVFLLTRIREHMNSTDPRTAVARGLRSSAGTITSAALIMVSVFAAFASVGVPSIKMIGFGLAVAIALDATLVRLVLVPATMELLGKWNWWLPSFLERRLPELSFEGTPAPPAPAPALATASEVRDPAEIA